MGQSEGFGSHVLSMVRKKNSNRAGSESRSTAMGVGSRSKLDYTIPTIGETGVSGVR